MNNVREFLGSKLGLLVCLVFAVVGVYLLWTHTGHVFSALPYVLLLACPLLHFFGHGHGHAHAAGPAAGANEKKLAPSS